MNTTSEQKYSLLGIRGKLFLGFGAVIAIFLLSVIVTLSVVETTKNYTYKVVTNELPTYDGFLDLNTQIFQSQVFSQMWLMTGDAKYKEEYNSLWESINQMQANLDRLSMQWSDKTYLINWQNIKSYLIDLKKAEDKVFNLSIGKDNTATQLYLAEITPIANKVIGMLNTVHGYNSQELGILDIQSQLLHAGTTNILNNLDTLQIIEYSLITIGVLASILVSYFTARAILRHISIFRNHSSRVAAGDLTQHIVVTTADEIGQLGNDLNTMTSGLAIITKEIIKTCVDMVATLEEVRHAVDVQSSGASEQAASINEITASISEIERSSSQTREKAQTLGEVAERTREKGQVGLEAVEESVKGMKAVRNKVQMIAQTILELSNQTQQVGEITAVVNNLAQQSKMLALNASIEAAKAGEAGKGFAVVAAEVKNLAEQSEQSTAQVQKILEDIRHAAEKAVMVTEEGTKGVDYGTGLVEQTGEVIRSLNEVINETTLASEQIEAAVRQESAGIEQITAGMNEINQVTASFVDGVKQTTEAMENLAKITKNLKSHVDVYKV